MRNFVNARQKNFWTDPTFLCAQDASNRNEYLYDLYTVTGEGCGDSELFNYYGAATENYDPNQEV